MIRELVFRWTLFDFVYFLNYNLGRPWYNLQAHVVEHTKNFCHCWDGATGAGAESMGIDLVIFLWSLSLQYLFFYAFKDSEPRALYCMQTGQDQVFLGWSRPFLRCIRIPLPNFCSQDKDASSQSRFSTYNSSGYLQTHPQNRRFPRVLQRFWIGDIWSNP